MPLYRCSHCHRITENERDLERNRDDQGSWQSCRNLDACKLRQIANKLKKE